MKALVIAIVTFFLTMPGFAQYSGGSGTAEDPYRIATAADLIALGEEPNDYDKHFILTADIDLDPNLPGGKVFDRAVIAWDINDDERWFQGTAFTGVFHGNDHRISNLTIIGDSYLGLFGSTDGAAISDLSLEAVDVNGIGGSVGGLVGDNAGSITNCHIAGRVTGGDGVGGMVGLNGGSISNCRSAGIVSGNGNGDAGGLVGCQWGSITNCSSSSVVSGGGGAESGVGGLVGYNGGSINTSFSTGSVSGIVFVGGLVGLARDSGIWSCYSTGSVSGDGWVGGLVGSNHGSGIRSCYSIGRVSGESGVGGLIGSIYGSNPSCFWNTETSGQSTSGGGIGLTTAEMMDPYVLGLYGLLVNDPNWVLDAGHDYPRLAWEGTPGQVIPEPVIDWLDGQGTEQEPYRIDTAEQLVLLGQARVLWDKHFVLGADIDLDPNLPGCRS